MHPDLERVIHLQQIEDAAERASVRAKGGVPIGVGPRSVVQNAIVDKNARSG